MKKFSASAHENRQHSYPIHYVHSEFLYFGGYLLLQRSKYSDDQ